jgi:hypothetical protein
VYVLTPRDQLCQTKALSVMARVWAKV